MNGGGTVFLGWYDPDKKRPATDKMRAALRAYANKFNREAMMCLTSPDDAAALLADEGAPENVGVKGLSYIPRFTFYVGREG